MTLCLLVPPLWQGVTIIVEFIVSLFVAFLPPCLKKKYNDKVGDPRNPTFDGRVDTRVGAATYTTI